MIFTSACLALRNNKNLIQVPYSSIACVYILDRMKEERAKKVYMLLQFEDGFSAPHGKKSIRNITIETKDSLVLDVNFPETPSNGEQQRQFKACSQTRTQALPQAPGTVCHCLSATHASVISVCAISMHNVPVCVAL